jgi:poly(A) polymerase
MGFPTCQEAYNRVRWDAALDATAYTIGYATRAGAIKEKPLLSWDPEGDIPWHRVRYMRCGDTIMWDREARIDLIVRPQPGAQQAPAPQPQSTPITSQPAWRWDGARWSHGALPQAQAPLRLRVITQNALFDTFEAEKLDTPARTALLLAALRDADADLIAIEEATPALLHALLAQDWVRARYHLSDGPDAASITPHGQLLLSRLPMTCGLHTFSPQKRLLLATVTPPNTPPLCVAVAHLTSNRAPDGPTKRAAQLDTTLALTRAAPHLILLGDLNLRDGELAAPLTQHDMLDLWPMLRPGEDGYTYDPSQNTLARALSSSGEPGRYDRIFVRSEHELLRAADIQLFGLPSARDATPLSDHWGLAATLDLITARAGRPTVTTALALVLPHSMLGPIQDIRREHDPSFERWMPHINLVYPFVPLEDFDAAAAQITAAMADQAPIPITLAGLDQFEHRAARSIWIKPASAGRIEALRARLIALFPQCDDPESRSGSAYTPHMTLAKLPADAPWRHLIQSWQAALEPLRFQAASLVMLAREADAPFSVRRVIQLGLPARIEASLAACPDATLAQDPSPAIALLRRAAGEAAHLHMFGSHALGVAMQESDLDVVIASPHDHTTTLQNLSAALRHNPGVSRMESALEATVPVIRARIDDTNVDIICAHIHADAAPEHLITARAAALDDASRRALDGVLGAEFLIEALCELDALDEAQAALRWLKVWAKRRGVSGTAWGFWGGFTWAILATRAAQDLRRARELPTPELIATRALEIIARWPWPAPLTLDAATDPAMSAAQARRGRADHMPVLHPLAPHDNTTRSMTAATAAILIAEARAAYNDGAPRWALDPLEPPTGERIELLLGDGDGARGWLERRVVALLLELERAGAGGLRPHPRGVEGDDGLVIPIALTTNDEAQRGAVKHAALRLEADAARDGVPLAARYHRGA